MLQNLEKTLNWAKKNNTIVAALSVSSHLTARAAITAAEKVGVPVILQYNQSILEGCVSLEEIAPVLYSLATQTSIPVTLHLNHGRTMDEIETALKFGFNSIMFDGTLLSFDETIFWAKKIRNLTRAYGASLEIAFGEDRNRPYEVPENWNEYGNTMAGHNYSKKTELLRKMAKYSSLAWKKFYDEGGLDKDKKNFTCVVPSVFDESLAFDDDNNKLGREMLELGLRRIQSCFEAIDVEAAKELMRETEADVLYCNQNSKVEDLTKAGIVLAMHETPEIKYEDLLKYRKQGILKLNYSRPVAAYVGKKAFSWMQAMEKNACLEDMTANELLYIIRQGFQEHYKSLLTLIKRLSDEPL